jgi:hypothetical protein
MFFADSHATQVIIFLLLAFIERCSILHSTTSWADNRMVNVGLRFRFYCVQGKFSARPLLYFGDAIVKILSPIVPSLSFYQR